MKFYVLAKTIAQEAREVSFDWLTLSAGILALGVSINSLLQLAFGKYLYLFAPVLRVHCPSSGALF